ncbi:hypothetical protein KEM56_003024 [Ascosphaera pollenicola]|nr:hypothetical protein KEM56_003024 [Ascosphaera pollenicola]
MHSQSLKLASTALRLSSGWAAPYGIRQFSRAAIKCASSASPDVQGPPPTTPSTQVQDRLAWKNQKEEMLRSKVKSKEPVTFMKRFWKDVHVKETPEGYQVLLDKRPVRAPTDKSIVTIPRTKPHVAHAIALEWDSLTLAKHALKPHLVPMTGLIDRTLDIIKEDAQGIDKTRREIEETVMRYFDTDTLLSWAPGRSDYEHPLHEIPRDPRPDETLRDLQIRKAQEVTSFLLRTIWPGITILPAFEGDSIFPTPQPRETQLVIRDWVRKLDPYDLAGLERAALASKSVLIAARLVIEWSENFRHLQPATGARQFGMEEAALASTLEVTWQTKQWGEVEDTHDVDKEDVRRQLGSVVLLVSGEK